MSYLIINGTDVSHLVQGMKVGYETLVADNSGRNANGDTVLDIVNRKAKVYVNFRPMGDADMSMLLASIGSYVIPVTFRDSKTNELKTITCYTGTPEPEYYWILDSQVLYKPMSLNFIEM
jgi:hypothetical protein